MEWKKSISVSDYELEISLVQKSRSIKNAIVYCPGHLKGKKFVFGCDEVESLNMEKSSISKSQTIKKDCFVFSLK